jgi:magnesium-transporting ATPase (P-type)
MTPEEKAQLVHLIK